MYKGRKSDLARSRSSLGKRVFQTKLGHPGAKFLVK